MKESSLQGITFDDILLIPRESNIASRLSRDLDLRTRLTKKRVIDYPIVGSPMNCVTDVYFAKDLMEAKCTGIIHRYQTPEEAASSFGPFNRATPIAIGINDEARFNYLYKKDFRVFCIDVANGHTQAVADNIKQYKKVDGVEIIAGNVATGEAALFLEAAGADAIRVGVGSGASCVTRIVTGCGVPSLTAIMDIHSALETSGNLNRIPIIADGGIRSSGDIIKALAAGADTVMLGFLLAPFSSAGRVVIREKIRYKIYEGQASRKFQEEVRGEIKKGTAPEGVEHLIPMRYDMTLSEYIENEIIGGVRSAMTYLNCKNLIELRDVEYLRVSQASIIESYPRLL